MKRGARCAGHGVGAPVLWFALALVGMIPARVDAQTQNPIITFNPSVGSYPAGSQVNVTIEWCAPAGTFDGPGWVWLNGQNVTNDFPFSSGWHWSCEDYATSQGTITLAAGQNTLRAEITSGWPGGYSEAFAYYTGSSPNLSVSATPDGATTPYRQVNTSGFTAVFQVQNTGQGSDSYSFSCAGVGLTCSYVTPAGAALAPGAAVNVTATYATGGAGTGRLTLHAGGATGANDSAWFNVPIAVMSVSATPKGSTTPSRSVGETANAVFTVQNTGQVAETYSLACTGAGITCNSVTPSSANLGAGQSAQVTVSYTVTGAGVPSGSNGWVTLTATGATTDQAYFYIPIARVSVQRFAEQIGRPPQSGMHLDSFLVRNTGSVAGTFAFSCGGYSLFCTIGGVGEATLQPDQPAVVRVLYGTEFAPGNAHLRLAAVSAMAAGSDSTQVTILHQQGSLPQDGGPTVIVLPPGGYRAEQTMRVVIEWCGYTPYPYDPASMVIKHNGVNVTPQFSTQPIVSNSCTVGAQMEESHRSEAILTLVQGVNTVYAEVRRLANPSWIASHQVAYDYVPSGSQEPTSAVARLTASAQYSQVRSGANTRAFTLTNIGNASGAVAATVSCTGSASGCGVSPANPTLQPGASTTLTVNYTAGSVGSSGRVTVTATAAGGGDSQHFDFDVVAAPAPGVVLVQTPGVLERSLCVAAAAGAGAAYECGDLRLTHALPVVRTRNAARQPTLIYNSQHAAPFPLVAADVRLPAGLPAGDTVIALVTIGSVTDTAGRWASSHWSNDWPRRITMAASMAPAGLTTGFHPFTLELRTKSGTVVGTVNGEVPVVNRMGSPFGSGWWLAGLESLNPATMVWVGGDGSMRRFLPSGTPGIWLGPQVDRPDTLSWNPPLARYVRHYRNGLQVRFDSLGRHRETVNRQGQVTVFNYSGTTGRVTALRIPPDTSAVLYTFVYSTSNRLDSVIAPPIGTTPRATRLTRTGSRVTTIRDPDGTTVLLQYGSGVDSTRVIRRTNRHGYRAWFAYSSAKRIRMDSLELDATTRAVTLFYPGESRGFATAAAPVAPWRADTVYTLIDGPRTDVNDHTRFYINVYGAPTRIRNALGEETRVVYDPTWPALAVRAVAPNAFEARAFYSTARGLVDSVTALDPLGTGAPAITRYLWHSKWDMVTRILSPTGLRDSIVYDIATGNRMSQLRSSQSVSFTYYTSGAATGLVRTIAVAGLPAESLIYDARGNLARSRSAIGFNTVFRTDAIGRDTLVYSPIDSALGLSEANVVANGSRVRTRYDIMSRVIQTVSWGPIRNVPGHPPRSIPADSVLVLNTFDLEGNPTLTIRVVAPNVTPAHWWSYDRAGRMVTETSPGAGTRSLTLDRAGNVTTVQTSRGHTMTMKYDALGRVTERIVPGTAFGAINCTEYFGPQCYFSLPVDAIGGVVCVRADTSRFTYDHAGNMTAADNWAARVRRSYTPSGLVQSETQSLRTYFPATPRPCEPMPNGSAGPEWGQHDYTLTMEYDLEGRRTRLLHPNGIDACTGQCWQRYGYNDSTGTLDTLIDVLGHTHLFRYDNVGRQVARVAPGNWRDSTVYDSDSRVRRMIMGLYSEATLARDAGGRVVGATVTNMAGMGLQYATLAYNGLGALAFSSGIVPGSTFEEFSTDAIGNRRQHRDNGFSPDYPDRRRSFSYDTHGRVVEARDTTQGNYQLFHNTYYDAAGNVSVQRELDVINGTPSRWLRASYYSAEERLAAHASHRDTLGVSGAGGVYEEYRYDALGRRVLVRARQTDWCNQPQAAACGHIERTVWDGDQVLYEIRARGGIGATATQLENDNDAGEVLTENRWGRVLYQHAGGIDMPVNIIRMRMAGQPEVIAVSPHANWQGDMEVGSLMSGTSTDQCSAGQYGCPVVGFPGSRIPADGGAGPSGGGWFGNLITGKTDASGLQYMRNRYYDPATGRFTQQDPIGLAGGLNLYGFAGGDPVNFSDPFGLSRDTVFKDDAARDMVRTAMRHSPTIRRIVGEYASNSGITVTFSTAFGALPSIPNTTGAARCSGVIRLSCEVVVDVVNTSFENFLLGDLSGSTTKPEDILAHEIGHVEARLDPTQSMRCEECANQLEDTFRSEAGRPSRPGPLKPSK
jgi:RHS repeat-associated protein